MPSLADRRSVSEEQCRVCLETGSVAGAAYDQGLATYRVPMALHALNRARLCEALSAAGASGVVLLEGGEQQTPYDTDHEPVFRQESYFQWLFGVAEPGCYGAVRLSDGEATLFVPDLRSEAYEIFCGAPPALADFAATSDSGDYAKPASFAGDDRFRKDRDALFPVIADLRTIKTPAEIEVLRYVNYVSSMAHSEVMRAAKTGMMEYQLESLFQHHTYTHGGCRHMAYTCICACGPNPAVLHYGHAGAPNARSIGAGETALLDMGAEYHCYAADITCSFPVGAEGFTPDQQLVYEAVLAAQVAV
ncbi:manganese ion binding protein [Aureococcus anophagefferens]|nr:manganese ion binding protein [Aureococcus anophagefferens]